MRFLFLGELPNDFQIEEIWKASWQEYLDTLQADQIDNDHSVYRSQLAIVYARYQMHEYRMQNNQAYSKIYRKKEREYQIYMLLHDSSTFLYYIKKAFFYIKSICLLKK